MILVTEQPLSPEQAVRDARTNASGCVVTYVGLIRDNARDKSVLSVEYRDASGNAAEQLEEIAEEIRQRWPVETVVIYHRTGILKVGDINLIIAIAAGHRGEGFEAASYAVDRFKEKLPTSKKEIYADGTVFTVA